jgi:hypothetical protein
VHSLKLTLTEVLCDTHCSFFPLVACLTAQTFNVKISGGGQTAVPGTEFGAPITVQVVTSGNLPAQGVQVTISFPPTAAVPSALFNFNVRTVTLTTNGQGIATSPIFGANVFTGTYTGTVSVNGQQTVNFQQANAPFSYAPPTVAPDSLVFNMNVGDPAPAAQVLSVSSPTDGFGGTADQTFIKLTQQQYVPRSRSRSHRYASRPLSGHHHPQR